VVNRRLVGIVTDRDLRSASPSIAEAAAVDAGTIAGVSLDPEKTPIERVMTDQVITLGPKDTVEQATRLMLSERIGAIPIVEKGRRVGIIARSDVLGAFLGLIASVSGALDNAKPAGRSRSKPTRAKSARSKSARSKA
jgi:acetoin utilization protein AcuB